MTTIRLGVLHPTGTATDARTTGSVEWVPTARRIVGTNVVLPEAFTVTLSATEDVTRIVDPTTSAWVWKVLERVRGGANGWRYLAVPDSVPTLDYSALVEVDPATLDPIAAAPTVQALLDGKAPLVHTQAAATISDSTATGRSVLTAADAAAARSAIGAGTSSLVLGAGAGTALDAAAAATTYAPLDHQGSGFYYAAPRITAGAASLGVGDMHLTRLDLAGGAVLTRIAAKVAAVGAAGSLVRLGIYTDSGGRAGTLLLDAGTIDATVLGVTEITISQTIPTSGHYWLCATASVAAPTMVTASGAPAPVGGAAADAFALVGHAYSWGITAGALPTTFPNWGFCVAATAVVVKVA